ncbi:class I SAM-dependent methyltransferase [Demetria terragena]|uniref:class I SAM-dependent methyltransferase n=1 Tax=Demetria terragena TaxID=63959 RepID=UPI000377DB66|nr:class I SAM-dependent methyltransferase [Demetria terragena]
MGSLDKFVPPGSRRRAVAGKVLRQVKNRVPSKQPDAVQTGAAPVAAAPKRATSAPGFQHAGPSAKGRPTDVNEEQRTLKSSWAKHDPDALDSYLVSGFQNPQVNAQSIMARHLLVDVLFDDDFSDLKHREMEHCVKATKALHKRADELGVTMGSYLDDAKRAEVLEVAEAIRPWQGEFEKEWAATLADRTVDQPRKVLEFACGSANDYRFFHRYGIAKHLDYTGVDLNDKNITNAKRRFPGVDFQVGSVHELPYADRSYDDVVVFDLFEHMSIEAMEKAVSEACRLADKRLLLTFFSMTDAPEHHVRPVRTYFWNVLSRTKVQELIEEQFGPVEVIRIRDLILDDFGYDNSYNKNAWTFIAKRRA